MIWQSASSAGAWPARLPSEIDDFERMQNIRGGFRGKRFHIHALQRLAARFKEKAHEGAGVILLVRIKATKP